MTLFDVDKLCSQAEQLPWESQELKELYCSSVTNLEGEIVSGADLRDTRDFFD